MINDFYHNFRLYVFGCQAIYDKDFADRGYSEFQRQKLSYKFGKKYAKVISERKEGGGGSVHSFVNMLNGDVLKPAGSKAPAKHARGNIYSKGHGCELMTPYGPHYLK